MPSSKETEYLKLNNWLGNDKLKRDDINDNNQKIDDAFFELAGTPTQWTPSISGYQVTSSYCYYIKRKNIVYIQGYIVAENKGTGSGNLVISGAPHRAVGYAVLPIGYSQNISNIRSAQILSSNINLVSNEGPYLTFASAPTSFQIVISGAYYTND